MKEAGRIPHKRKHTHARAHTCICTYTCACTCTSMSSCTGTADPTWGDIFGWCFKSQSSKLESFFSLKRGKRDVRALSFEISKMSPQVGLAVPRVYCNMSE